MELLKPIYMRKNWNKAVSAIQKENDQIKLIDAAKNSPHARARYDALQKVNDQSVIEQFARTNTDRVLCTIAITKLSDLTVVRDIMRGHKDAYTRLTAFEKLYASGAMTVSEINGFIQSEIDGGWCGFDYFRDVLRPDDFAKTGFSKKTVIKTIYFEGYYSDKEEVQLYYKDKFLGTDDEGKIGSSQRHLRR